MDYVDAVREQVNDIAYGFFAILPNLAVALVVLLLTWAIAKLMVRIVLRALMRANIRPDLRNLTETVVRLRVWILGLLIAAAVAVPSFTPAGLIAGLGIGALAIGFAFQDIFENSLAGVLIMLRDKMNIGDLIEVEGTLGKVEKITLRETHVRQLSNELTIMPNSMVFKNSVKILTDAPMRRDEIMVGLSYDADLNVAEAAISKAFAAYRRDRGGAAGRCVLPRIRRQLDRFPGPVVERKRRPARHARCAHRGHQGDQARTRRGPDRDPLPHRHNMFPEPLTLQQPQPGEED